MLTVLLADDDALLRKVTRLTLERLGVACDAVANGAEAVLRWREVRHGLVLIDVEMPELRGPDVARLIRAETTGVRPFLVALTGHDDGPELQEMLAAGVDRAVQKPLRSAVLGELLAAARRQLVATAPAATVVEGELPVLDRTALDRLAELSGDPTLVVDLAAMFRADAEDRMAAIRDAGDAEELSRAAHAFKSSSGTLGARALHQACSVLEERARCGDVERREELVAAVQAALEQVLAALETLET